MALCYAREGADIAINYLSETQDALRTAELVEEAGSRVLVIPGEMNRKRLALLTQIENKLLE